MSFIIRLYEKDQRITSLLRKRLILRFPEAFIRSGDDTSDIKPCTNEDLTVCIYNSDVFSSEEFTGNAVSHGDIIDCKEICDQIIKLRDSFAKNRSTSVSNTVKGSIGYGTTLLFSFAYIDERESFIKSFYDLSSMKQDINIRIDLMSGIRMPSCFTCHGNAGSLSTLLRSCIRPGFNDEDILEYLNPDSNGFLVAGKPDSSDDVFDIGIGNSIMLIKRLSRLCESSQDRINALIVAEGFKTSDMGRLAQYSSSVGILLPSRSGKENDMADDLEMMIREQCSFDKEINFYFLEDIKKNEKTMSVAEDKNGYKTEAYIISPGAHKG